MPDFLDPNVTTYGWILVGAYAILTVGLTVHLVQLPSKLYVFLTASTASAYALVVATMAITERYLEAREHSSQALPPVATLVLPLVAALVLMPVTTYFAVKRQMGLSQVCGAAILAAVLLFVGRLASGASVAWIQSVFDIGKYVALFPLAGTAVLRMVFPRRWHTLRTR